MRIRNTILSGLLMLFTGLSAGSQTIDSTLFPYCRSLYIQGKLKEARDCYLIHDTNIYAIDAAARISRKLNERKEFKKLSKMLLSKGHQSGISYKLYAELNADDPSKYIKIIRKGLKVFENDTTLLTDLANYYLTKKIFADALSTVNKLLVLKKDDKKSLYFAKGYAYQMLNDDENALVYYNKAIELDSGYYDPYFNIASVYYNQAVKLLDDAIYVKNDVKYRNLRVKGNEILAKAIPYLRKADSIKPDNLTVLNILKTIYYRLGYENEYQEISKRIDILHSE